MNNTTNTNENVQYLGAKQTPTDPFNGLPGKPGWYWRSSPTAEWQGPAPHGQAQAQAYAAMGANAR